MVSSRVGGVLGLISGSIAIFSIFLVWLKIEWGIITDETTGWNVFQNADLDYYMIPIIVAIIGVAVLIFSMVGLAGMKNVAPAKVMGALILLLGISCVVLTVFYYYEGIIQTLVNSGLFDVDSAMEFSPIGTGVIAGVVAGILMVISGALGLASKSSK